MPAGLIELIMQCLAKEPDGRPSDADAMVEALIDCVQASMFHLPLADSSTGGFVSAASVSGANDVIQPQEISSASLSRAAALAAVRERPPTLKPSRPPTLGRLRPPSMLAPEAVNAIITLEAAAVATPRGNWGLIAGAVVALLIGGLIAAIYVLGDHGAPSSAAASSGVGVGVGAARPPVDENRLGALLSEVESDIMDGNFEKARASLDAAAIDLETLPKLKARAERQRDRIAVATTYASAQRLEKEGKRGAAISAYQDILAIDPSHVDARTALARLREAEAADASAAAALVAPPPVEGPSKAGRRVTKPLKAADDTGATNTGAETPPPEVPPETPPPPVEDEGPFLPVAKKDDGGIFLPVGGKK